MDWETFSTKFVPWSLIIFGIVFVGSFLFSLIYLWYLNRKELKE
jgi:cbb3-type cytochrome oxidase subunit 3